MSATQRSFRYYDLVMVSFVTVLICSNLIGPAKIAQWETPWLAGIHPALATLTFGLLLFMYNTGARVQEVADTRVSWLTLAAPFKVELLGKGRKWRTCPLWGIRRSAARVCWSWPGRSGPGLRSGRRGSWPITCST